jgi:6-phosphogluconolactonase
MARKLIKLLIVNVFASWLAAGAWADGAVYAMTNALENNEVNVYHRAADGSLTLIQTAATGGGGSGLQLAGVDSLGSAGSVQLDPKHRFLFVVNTESAAENNGAGAYNTDCQQGTITSFLVESDGTLTFADRVFSRGLFPNSLTVRKQGGNDLLYVLNAGGPEVPICHLTPDAANTPNITGFTVDGAGHMNPVDSTQPIDPGPASAPPRRQLHLSRSRRFFRVDGCSSGGFPMRLEPALIPTIAGAGPVYARW